MNPQNENLILDDCCEVSCCGGVTTDKNRPQERAPEADCCLVTCCDEPANDVVETSAASLRTAVREQYEMIAKGKASSCCAGGGRDGVTQSFEAISQELGYSEADINIVPAGANMGLGCGNPQAIADLKKGETVLDLGSGGGFDCFLAAAEVGEVGSVIGVDMTAAMLTKARANLEKTVFKNIDFRLGEIEHLPVANEEIDVIISNCVINLSPDKKQVFLEAFRVLKPGGRLAISDIVAIGELTADMYNDMDLYSGCMSGASPIEDIESWLRMAGFESINVKPKDQSREFINNWTDKTSITDLVLSASIEAKKPELT